MLHHAAVKKQHRPFKNHQTSLNQLYIDSKNKYNSSCLLREPTRESESTDFVDQIRILDVYLENQHENHMWVNYDFVDQIIDMCTNQNPLYKLDNHISNYTWVNYD
jgi:predicted acetyltransferase